MKERKSWDGICRCGHFHSEHKKSVSINYSAGRCGKCEQCPNFITDENSRNNRFKAFIEEFKNNGFTEQQAAYLIKLLDNYVPLI